MNCISFISYCSYPWKQTSLVAVEHRHYRSVSDIGDMRENTIGRYRSFSFVGDEDLNIKYLQNIYLVGEVG